MLSRSFVNNMKESNKNLQKGIEMKKVIEEESSIVTEGGEGVGREKNVEVERIVEPIRIQIRPGSIIEGAEEYWNENILESNSQTTPESSPPPFFNYFPSTTSTSNSLPKPISIKPTRNTYPLQSNHHYPNNPSIILHPFDPAFSPPTSPLESISIQFKEDLHLFLPSDSNYLSNFSTSSSSRNRNIRYNNLPNSPPSEEEIVDSSSNGNRKEKGIVDISTCEIGTQTEEEEINTRRSSSSRRRNDSKSRSSSTSSNTRKSSSQSRTRRSSKKASTSTNELMSRGRSTSPSHRVVIMPSSSSSSRRTIRSNSLSPFNNSPPSLSPSNSNSSLISKFNNHSSSSELEEEEEEEEEEFEYDSRFIDLPSLRTCHLKPKENNLILKNNRMTLFCAEQFRLLSMDRAKFFRTGEGYWRGYTFDLE